MSIRKKILLFLILIIALGIIVSYTVFFTKEGASFVTRRALEQYFDAKNFQVEDVKGALSEDVVYNNIEMTKLQGFPEGTALRIQQLTFGLRSLTQDGLFVKIDNARLKLPYSEAIVVHGTIQDGMLDCNVYSKSLDVKEILSVIPDPDGDLRFISGTISDADVYVKGKMLEPEMTGTFLMEKFQRKDFSVKDAPGSLNFKMTDLRSVPKMFGSISVEKGVFSSRRAKTDLILEPSRLVFNGVPKRFKFDLKGSAKVEQTDIHMTLEGSKEKPDLNLTSDPPYPKTQLLLMLATGKSYRSTDETDNLGAASGELAKGFVDYFIFSEGGGEGLAKTLGISEFNLKYDETTQGVDVKKDVTNRAGITAGIEQYKDATHPEKSSITQSVGGELNITDNISIDVEKRVKEEHDLNQSTNVVNTPVTDDRINLKYKTKF